MSTTTPLANHTPLLAQVFRSASVRDKQFEKMSPFSYLSVGGTCRGHPPSLEAVGDTQLVGKICQWWR